MIIRKMRCYFLYSVPVTEHMLSLDAAHTFGVTLPLLDKVRHNFTVTKAPLPAFYTDHYQQEHTPYSVSDPAIPHELFISAQQINDIPFFETLALSQDVRLVWEFTLALQTTGLITICIEVTEPKDSAEAYRLNGLNLNPAYRVIETKPLRGLWRHKPDQRPPLVTLDGLARAIHEHFFHHSGVNVRRFRALRHEIQIPFTAIEVDTDCETQAEFVAQNASALAELVFKPACWEVGRASTTHVERVLDASRIWSVAEDTYVVAAYSGAVYVKINRFKVTHPHENAGFFLTSEQSVFHCFKIVTGNYHFLRILDDLLDKEMMRLKKQVHQYQSLLDTSFERVQLNEDTGILREMNDFVIQVTNLEFDLIELMEELDNPDKLIDEEWHIALLNKFNRSLDVKAWHDGLRMRVNNLRELIQMVEGTYQRWLDLNMTRNIFNINMETKLSENREKLVGLIFGAFAIAELLGLFIALAFDDAHPMVLRLASWFDLSIAISHWVSSVGVAVLIIVVLAPILRYLNRD